jgi:DNA repair exonuclease SbcCD ATPase subunit
MSETANVMAEAFEAEAGTAPAVNVSGVDAPTVTEPTKATQKFYTEEDLAKVRSQEKEKLYPEIERLKDQLATLTKEKEEKAARKAAEAAEKEQKKAEKDKAKLKEELDAKDFAEVTANELREQLERERQERERAFALLEQERKFAELQTYRQQAIEANREAIIPQLLDYVQGNTMDEINSSIQSLVERSNSILESAQSAIQQQRKEMPGTRATLPGVGPLETNSEPRQFTAADIASMPMNEYAKVRTQILSARAQGKTSGILG